MISLLPTTRNREVRQYEKNERKLKDHAYALVDHQLCEILNILNSCAKLDENLSHEHPYTFVFSEGFAFATIGGLAVTPDNSHRFAQVQETMQAYSSGASMDFLTFVIAFRKMVANMNEEAVRDYQDSISLLLLYPEEVFTLTTHSNELQQLVESSTKAASGEAEDDDTETMNASLTYLYNKLIDFHRNTDAFKSAASLYEEYNR